MRWFVLARRLRRPRTALEPENARAHGVLARIASQTAKVGVDVVLTDSTIEPGVAGVFRPTLFWPRGISDRLTDEQVDAVVAHEMAHVRWHDNAAAMLHMVVEALFWFHPLVWVLGARLIDERERGCDEAVLQAGQERQAYAEGILRICEFHVSSPLTCVAGVTGSDLKRRIAMIMRGEVGRAIPSAIRWSLAAFLLLAVLVPVSLRAARQGAVTAPASPDITIGTDRFEVASVKVNKAGEQSFTRATTFLAGERVSVVNEPLYMLIRLAYPGFEDIIGGEKWMGGKGPNGNVRAERFDVTAKAQTFSTHDQLQTMFRALLAERFNLRVHVQQKAEPVYALTVVRGDGRLEPKLKTEAQDCEALRAPLRGTGATDPCGAPPEARIPGHVFKRSGNIDLLVNLLRIYVDRPVVDRTGLTGSFDWDLVFTPQPYIDGERQDPAVNPNGAPLFTAIQEQLGLKLVPQNDGVPVLVIDHAERPGENTADLQSPKPQSAATSVPVASQAFSSAGQVVSSSSPSAKGQESPAQKGPRFDVVSIKPTAFDESLLNSPLVLHPVLPGGRYSALISLQGLLLAAFAPDGIQMPNQIVGSPTWGQPTPSGGYYRINAEVGPDGPHDVAGLTQQLPVLMQALLKDRFQLAEHIEQRALPVYAVTMAREGRLGPALHESTADCADRRTNPRPDAPQCGITFTPSGAVVVGANMTTFATLASVLSGRVLHAPLGLPVRNRTNNEGRFDGEIDLSAEVMAAAGSSPSPTAASAAISAAWRDQLGLKLERAEDQTNVLVIDHIERPTEN